MDKKPITWVEVSKSVLRHNIAEVKKLLKPETKLCVCIKANAYGHGLVEAARVFLDSGADWLAVDKLFEAEHLRSAGIKAPIYVMGYIMQENLGRVADLDLRCVVYNIETVAQLDIAAKKQKKKAKVHLKIETGTNRQGVHVENLTSFLESAKSLDNVEIEGVCTHLSDIEDNKKTDFAKSQCAEVTKAVEQMHSNGFSPAVIHCANSAGTLLLPEMHMDMVRVGIAAYGMWPSQITRDSVQAKGLEVDLRPAFTWKTHIAQIKDVAAGQAVGYSRTHILGRDSRLAILPVGYYDGYDRGLSNKSYVLINDQKAAILGRVCMNMIIVDVTDIGDVAIEDEAVLLGRQVDQQIAPEQFAEWVETINYEITTRVNDRIPRFYVE